MPQRKSHHTHTPTSHGWFSFFFSARLAASSSITLLKARDLVIRHIVSCHEAHTRRAKGMHTRRDITNAKCLFAKCNPNAEMIFMAFYGPMRFCKGTNLVVTGEHCARCGVWLWMKGLYSRILQRIKTSIQMRITITKIMNGIIGRVPTTNLAA